MSQEQWWILDREGKPVDISDDRPADARPIENGSKYTPWYEGRPHLHIEDGKVKSGHLWGTLDECVKLMASYLEYEHRIIEINNGASDFFWSQYFIPAK